MHQPRLLFLDAYDSFSNNIISLLHERLSATVEVIKIDDKRFATTNEAAFHDFLRRFDAVVAGPGPGDPRNVQDLGLIGKLWHLPEDVCLPVLGICLGFQSLALAFGATAQRLREPRHGIVTEVSHQGVSLFQDVDVPTATQYHSLHIRLGHASHEDTAEGLWQATEECPTLEPLAWDFADDRNGPVLMAIKHKSKPFWGVQYHPESICTNDAGSLVIQNWWSEAFEWSVHRAVSNRNKATRFLEPESFSAVSDFGTPRSSASSPLYDLDTSSTGSTMTTAATTPGVTSPRVRPENTTGKVHWISLDMSDYDVEATTVLQAIQANHQDPVMLESGTKNGKPVRPETGRFSIIGCVDDARYIRYSTKNHLIESNLSGSHQRFSATINDVWTIIDDFMNLNRASDGPGNVPFWGGLIGFISYEAGLETIEVRPAKTEKQRPDVWFIFVQRSVVIDHIGKSIYLQTLHADDEGWMQSTAKIIETAVQLARKSVNPKASHLPGSSSSILPAPTPDIAGPSEDEYSNKVRTCQDHIRAGSSYELCLTDQSRVTFPSASSPTPQDLYHRLRTLNPAPFGAYLHLKSRIAGDENDLTILSSSPERFLRWSRTGKCQFRPIKGTVKKDALMTREKAETILNSDKEQAENLMIVDLIRHDLHGVVGPGNVTVEKLMQVEEYETVFQLVSVIEGQLSEGGKESGIDVLAASLPPGSMTGAPKKRSCELLTEIEGGHRRGLYSGVLGYMDVGGGGDFSVVIRTAYRWADDGVWCIGAGGAVTALSTAEGEFAEMGAKKDSSLAAFLRPG